MAVGTKGPRRVKREMISGVSVEAELLERECLYEAVSGRPAELVRARVSMDDANASIQILPMFAVSHLLHHRHATYHTTVTQGTRGQYHTTKASNK